jgi:hypothetical protein
MNTAIGDVRTLKDVASRPEEATKPTWKVAQIDFTVTVSWPDGSTRDKAFRLDEYLFRKPMAELAKDEG